MSEHLQINDVAPSVHYDADGVQAAFTFPFAVFRTADLEVWQDGARVLSGFSVSGAGISTGGVVLFSVPPAAGARIILRRRVALERISDFQTDGIIRAKTLNDELDYQVAAVQQVADDVSRCLHRPFTSASTADLGLPEPVAGRALKWNANADGLENSVADMDMAIAQATAQAEAATSARNATDADRTAVAADRAAVHADRLTADADAMATAADRVAVATDRDAVASLHQQAQQSAAAAEQSAASVGARLVGTSTSSLTIASGPLTLTVEPGQAWVAGMPVTICAAADPLRAMTGIVTAYDGTSGRLDVQVEDVSGSGSTNAWRVVISGRRGAPGAGSADLLAGNALAEIAAHGAAAQQAARGNLGLGDLAVKATATVADLTLSAPSVLGRTAPGNGAAAELSLSQVLDLVGNAAQGDVLYRGSTGWQRLAAGSSGQALLSGGSGGNPSWGTIQALPYAGGYRGFQVFTAGGTFTVPADVTELFVEVWGGGASGGNMANYCVGGSAGGYAARRIVGLSPGATIAVTVGGGGGGTPSGSYGNPGGTSSFGAYCSATGGEPSQGAPGSGIGGDINRTGGRGTYGVVSTGYSGGGGSAPLGGAGALGETGISGGVPGGGGGSMYWNSSIPGAPGGRGEVRVYW